MKVMYLVFSFTVGGTERLVADICNQMVVKEQDVYLYVVNDLVSNELLKTLDKRVKINLQNRKTGGRSRLSTLFKVANYIKKNKIEVVHCNSFNAPELLIISRIISPKTRIIHTIHGMNQYKSLSKFKVSLRNWICDNFIGISEAVKNDILKSGADPQKTIMIYNGINAKKYECAKFKQFDISHIKIGCVARIMPSIKGQDVLLKSVPMLIEKHPNILIEFAGGVAESQQDKYEELVEYVKNNALDDNVRFVGNINNIPAYLNTIDICVVPSRTEGFGLALIEAMSMGIPCVASDIAGPAEIVNGEKLGCLFICGDSKDLTKKIEFTIDEFIDRKAYAWLRKEEIINKYSIRNMCEKLMVVYQNR